MTIGPDPMRRIDSRSSLRGMPVHQVVELVEEVASVVGPGSGLGVVLDAERRRVQHAQALADTVVEVDVRHLRDLRKRISRDREVVVLARDLDLVRREAAYRMVAAVMAERQLVRLSADCE